MFRIVKAPVLFCIVTGPLLYQLLRVQLYFE